MDEEQLNINLGDKSLKAADLIAKLCAQAGMPLEVCLMIQAVLVMSGDPTTIIEPEPFAATIRALGERFGIRLVKAESPEPSETEWPDTL